LAAARNADKRYITDVRIFDVYEGENMEQGKKSVALTMTFQPWESSFTDKDIETLMSKVEQAEKQKCNAVLRDA
jgi:phenylalanyl-tRNA synthetase beta chain